jgi:hypothetical protein
MVSEFVGFLMGSTLLIMCKRLEKHSLRKSRVQKLRQ